MAEIVIATRQAVSLNGFSANTKQGDTKNETAMDLEISNIEWN